MYAMKRRPRSMPSSTGTLGVERDDGPNGMPRRSRRRLSRRACRNVVARVRLADVGGVRAELAERVAGRPAIGVVGAHLAAVAPVVPEQRLRGVLVAEVVVGAVVVGQPRVVAVGCPHRRRARRPATDETGTERLRVQFEPRRLRPQELMEPVDVLAQAAEDEVGAVLGPRRRQRVPGAVVERVPAPLLPVRAAVLAGIAEHELAGPDQLLAGLSLVGIVLGSGAA